ncbi:TraB family protein [compost metagenome]
MKSSIWNKLGRTLLSTTLGTSLILGGVLTAKANEAPAAVPQISSWSVSNLHEGEKYGIFPLTWYYDGTFQQPIDAAKFQSLITATTAKLDALGFKKKPVILAVPSDSKEITRDTVIQSLYRVLNSYELPESFEMGNNTPVEYLQKKGIVNGTNRGLDLSLPCTVEQAAVLASRLVEYTYETAQGGANGLFWKVTNKGNTLYLLGSIHIGIPEMYPFQKNIKDAFEESESLWVEANLLSSDQETMAYFQQLQLYNDGTTLKDHISKETYEKLQKLTTKLNMPANSFDTIKPWAITTSLSLLSLLNSPDEISQASTLGVDMYLLTSAMLSGKPIHELEGIKLQGDILSNVTPEQQEKELNQMLDALLDESTDELNLPEEFKKAQLQWAKGDLDAFSKSFLISGSANDSPESQRLLGDRDKNMANKLAELLEAEGESTHFVVVGAAHFVTKDMVLDQLKKKGYTVEFIQ